MKVLWTLGLVVCSLALVSGQNRQQQFQNNNNNNRFNNNNLQNNNRFNNNNNGFQNNNNGFQNNNNGFASNNNNQQLPVSNSNRFNTPVQNNNNNNGFRATPADGRDARGNEVYPGCNGTVCLPEANLCSIRKQKIGHFNYDAKSYWVSWASDEVALRNARWNWFTGRNYCRKMCMDMISIESKAEEDFIVGLMRTSSIKDIHTSGRLCDKEVEGCEAAHFQPININGWFWASTLKMMPPTNFVSNNAVYNNWAPGQPNGSVRDDGFGNEACMALLDNGISQWNDEACSSRRVLVCEDLPAPNINFVRNQNPNVNIP